MSKKKSTEKVSDTAEFLRIMRERYQRAIDADHDRAEAYDDLRFGLLSEQWRSEVKAEREADGRPVLTINKLPERVEQVTGTQRKSNIAIKARPVDDSGDVETAKVINGLLMNIAHNSDSSTAFDEAFDSTAWCGRGFVRVLTKYADDDVFDQDIYVEPIQERFSVVLDPAGKKYDRSDGRFAFIEQTMQRDDFKAQYPDVVLSEWDSAITEGGWLTDDEIRLVEYYWKEFEKKTIYLLEDGRTTSELAEGDKVRKKRNVETDIIKWCLCTGTDIIEGGIEGRLIPGKYIPIIPVWGKYLTIDGKQYSRGMIRYAKEPCRMYNYWRSEEYEFLSYQPKSPYIITAAQLGPYKEVWDLAHKKNFPYLPISDDPNAKGIPQRQHPPAGINAFSAQAQISHQEINATVGIHQESMGDADAGKSGRAIGLLQEKGDTGSFQFIDNLKKSMEFAGKVIIGMMPQIYDSERVVRIKNPDGSTRATKINAQGPNGEILNNLTTGKYDIYVDTGPDYLTQRIESMDFWMQMLQTAPDKAGLLMDIIVRNSDVKDSEEAEARLRKVLPPGIITEPREGEELPKPQQDPTMEIRMKGEAVKLAQEEARLAGLQKDNHKKDLEAEKLRIETVVLVDNNPRLGPHLGEFTAGFSR